jgi:glutathione S-transferase
MITIYHLDRSRSERAVWLMEELGAPYDIRHFDRLETLAAEPAYKDLHFLGSSPVIADDAEVIAESGAVIEYLATTQGQGRLALRPGDAGYAAYLYWFHFAESSLMPEITREIVAERAGIDHDHPYRVHSRKRTAKFLQLVDMRLDEAPFFAGEAFTAADIMMTFPFTTSALFTPVDLTEYAAIRAYLARIEERAAYRRCQTIAGPYRTRGD